MNTFHNSHALPHLKRPASPSPSINRPVSKPTDETTFSATYYGSAAYNSSIRSYSPTNGSQLSMKINQSLPIEEYSYNKLLPSPNDVKQGDRPRDSSKNMARDSAAINNSIKTAPIYRVLHQSESENKYIAGPYTFTKIESAKNLHQESTFKHDSPKYASYSSTKYEMIREFSSPEITSPNREESKLKSYEEYQYQPLLISDSKPKEFSISENTSLLDRFKKEKAEETPIRKDESRKLLTDPAPKISQLSQLPDSYVDKSQSDQTDKFVMEKEENFESPLKKHDNNEAAYFSFSPDNETWANGSTPSPTKLVDSHFFNSQQHQAKDFEQIKNDSGMNSLPNHPTELKELLKREMLENEKLNTHIKKLTLDNQRLQGQLVEARFTGFNCEEDEGSALQIDKKNLSEQLKLVKLQSHHIAEQAEEYKKVADGYVKQIEAKLGLQEKEIQIREDTIKRLQDEIERARMGNSSFSHGSLGGGGGNLRFPLAISNICKVYSDFLKDLDFDLTKQVAGVHSSSLVTQVLNQTAQLVKCSCEDLAASPPITELSNLRNLLGSLKKSIMAKLSSSVSTVSTPRYSFESPNKTERSSARDLSTSTERKRDMSSNTRRLLEENQKLATEYSKLKTQQKSLLTQIKTLSGEHSPEPKSPRNFY